MSCAGLSEGWTNFRISCSLMWYPLNQSFTSTVHWGVGNTGAASTTQTENLLQFWLKHQDFFFDLVTSYRSGVYTGWWISLAPRCCISTTPRTAQNLNMTVNYWWWKYLLFQTTTTTTTQKYSKICVKRFEVGIQTYPNRGVSQKSPNVTLRVRWPIN